jgi:Tfp pilus assembly protein PilE
MLARLLGFSQTITGILIIGALIVGVWASIGIYGYSKYREGRQVERSAWEEAQRKLRDQMDIERRAAQAEIDRIHQDYLDQRQRDVLAIEALEAAIQEMENTDDADASCACRPALPRGLSKSLDAVGR